MVSKPLRNGVVQDAFWNWHTQNWSRFIISERFKSEFTYLAVRPVDNKYQDVI